MSILTLRHCIFCYKEESPSDSISANTFTNTNTNAKTEVCRRFCTLASRYLSLNPNHFRSKNTLKSKLSVNVGSVCDECLEISSSFCDMYTQMDNLKTQMNWRIHEMCKVMNAADKDDSPNSEYRQVLLQKFEKFGRTMKEIDDFRNDFVAAATRKEKSSEPRMRISQLSEDEDSCSSDSSSYFIPVQQNQPKDKHNRSHPADLSISSSSDSDISLFAVKIKHQKQNVGELSETPSSSGNINSACIVEPASASPVDHSSDQFERPASLVNNGETHEPKIVGRIDEERASPNSNCNGANAVNLNLKFKCEKCPKSFSQPCSLRYHHEAVHDMTLYTCPYCKGTNKYRINFVAHLKKPPMRCVNNRPTGFNYKTVNIDDCKTYKEVA